MKDVCFIRNWPRARGMEIWFDSPRQQMHLVAHWLRVFFFFFFFGYNSVWSKMRKLTWCQTRLSVEWNIYPPLSLSLSLNSDGEFHQRKTTPWFPSCCHCFFLLVPRFLPPWLLEFSTAYCLSAHKQSTTHCPHICKDKLNTAEKNYLWSFKLFDKLNVSRYILYSHTAMDERAHGKIQREFYQNFLF